MQLQASRPTPSAPPVEITAALTRVMSSLDDLANDCRSRGIDPMTLIMSVISGNAAARTGTAPVYVPLAVDAPSDAELIEHSRSLIGALDRGDVTTVAEALAPGFIAFRDGGATDRDAMLAIMVPRKATGPHTAERTWHDESVVRKDDTLVFTGKAREIQAGNETKGGYLHVGWYLVQWVRAGDAWRAQLLTWQRESTDRDWFNEVFHNDRGFSHQPNRLLVDAVEHEPPGAALDVAMGQGRNALYLASRGWKVIGIDAADKGLRIARAQASQRGLALDAIHADIDVWDFGENRFDLVTLIYAGDHGRWIHKIQATLRPGGLFVVEGWAKDTPHSSYGFGDGQLAELFAGYDILRDDTADDVPDWACDRGRLVRFVARKPG